MYQYQYLIPYSQIGLHIKCELPTRPRSFSKVWCGWVGGGWSKGILELCFGPNLGLRLEAYTKLNNC